MKTELEERTKKFAMKIVEVAGTFPQTSEAQIVRRQLLRAGSSLGTNCHEANQAKSEAEFIRKIEIAQKEASETICWLEVCQEDGLGKNDTIDALLKEAGELVEMLITIGGKEKSSK